MWKGEKPVQRPIKGLTFSMILQVPNTSNSTLLKEIAKVEPKLARTTGYSAKLVEKSGVQLGRLFDRKMERRTCGRDVCLPCESTMGKSRCKKCNVVYRATCQTCIIDGSTVPGTYIGETSRTLAERTTEHALLLNNLVHSSFIVKHWANDHSSLTVPPLFKFEMVTLCLDSSTKRC